VSRTADVNKRHDSDATQIIPEVRCAKMFSKVLLEMDGVNHHV